MSAAMKLDDVELIDPIYYAEHGYPHEAFRLLRREAPVYHFDRLEMRPFWAVTRHRDIVEISRRPDLYLNAPRLVVGADALTGESGELPVRMLLNMDPPDHAAYRSLVNKRFTPRALRDIARRIDAIATRALDDIFADGEESEVDFVREFSAKIPIWVIAELLGVPESDWELLFDWTNRVLGAADPEYREEGKSPQETVQSARLALFSYFQDLTNERRARPKEDLVSVLTHAKIDGAELPVFELMSYYFLIVVAGNETTRNAASGGLLALIENPDQLALARERPDLNRPLVEEVLRWTSPVIHFCRTPTRDVELHGQTIREGETLTLFYPSANRDESIFEDADCFRVDRQPNRHIAFGIGEHVCLGAHVARFELQVIFRHLLARLADVELAGPVERLRSSVVGGIKHMPIRYRLLPAANAA